jgi:hypothetical protein
MEDNTRPTLTGKAKQDAEDRRLRQAEALRANLARRKARSRVLADTPPSDPDADATGSE